MRSSSDRVSCEISLLAPKSITTKYSREETCLLSEFRHSPRPSSLFSLPFPSSIFTALESLGFTLETVTLLLSYFESRDPILQRISTLVKYDPERERYTLR